LQAIILFSFFSALSLQLPGLRFGSDVAFLSFRDNPELSTPSGRLMFQIIGAMAEFERALIQERVRAGLRNARAKGKKLGRPRAGVQESQIEGLRASGASWRAIAKQTGFGVGTVLRIAQRRSKNLFRPISVGGVQTNLTSEPARTAAHTSSLW